MIKTIACVGGFALAVLTLSHPLLAQESYSQSTPLAQTVRWTKIETTFVARQVDRVVNDNGPSGHSISDTADSYGELLDAKKKIIGRYDTISRATDVWSDGERRMLMAEYTFADGRDAFVIFGAGRFMANTGRAEIATEHVFPITGGKGRYLGATGQCTVRRVHAVDTHVQCTLYVPNFAATPRRS